MVSQRDMKASLLVILSVIAVVIFVWISVRASGELNWMFTFGYLAICVTLPLAAERGALFTAVFLAPILMAVATATQTLWVPDSIIAEGLTEKSGAVSHFIAAYLNQAVIVAIGFLLSLAALALRLAAKPRA